MSAKGINWTIVALDFVLLVDFAILASWFYRGVRFWALKYVSISFALIGVTRLGLLIDDLLVALNFSVANAWLLTRPVLDLVWRVGAVVGFTAIVLILKFGEFDDGNKRS